MGDTYLFLDETTNIEFAIKKYSPKFGEDDYERFVEEIKILFQVSHPNIVRIYNYYLYPDSKMGYLQMEFVEGEHIHEFSPKWGKGWDDIFVETINAFTYLEEVGVLHRDIRPQNIMIDKNENVKVIDFGFGKTITSEDKPTSISVYLNWPYSEKPSELTDNNIYNHQTEIFYLGQLFKSIDLDEGGHENFSYYSIVDKMSKTDPNRRFNSFSEISIEIASGRFKINEFTEEELSIYQAFASELVSCYSEYTEYPIYNESITDIQNKLAELIRCNKLEKEVQHTPDLARIFVKSAYKYWNDSTMSIKTLIDFTNWLSSLDNEKQRIVLDNILSRLRTINTKIVDEDDDMPF